jgi:hypothetical protein
VTAKGFYKLWNANVRIMALTGKRQCADNGVIPEEQANIALCGLHSSTVPLTRLL